MFDRTAPWFLYLVAFVSGCAVMAIEITSSRLLAPFFGTSLIVWTNIIGAVMIALATGYYFGGVLADKRPDIQILLWLLTLTGAAVMFVPSGIRWVGNHWVVQSFSENDFSVPIFAFVSSMLILVVPIFFLGMSPPYIVKIYSARNGHIGTIAGSVSAASTIGSIAGTYLPTFWTIPSFGSQRTIMGFAAALILLGIVGLIGRRPRIVAVLLLLSSPILGTILVAPFPATLNATTAVARESPYHFIRVLEDPSGNHFMVFNQGFGFQSSYYPGKILTGEYSDYYSTLPSLQPKKMQNVLLIGLAGGTIPRQLKHFYGGDVEITAVEIDPETVELAKQYFGLDQIGLQTVIADARIFLGRTTEKYDMIIVDAFHNEYEIPWTLTTGEFWRAAKKRLSPGGIIAMNIVSLSPENKLVKAIANTIAQEFEFTNRTDFDAKAAGNTLILGSEQEIVFGQMPVELGFLAQKISTKSQRIVFAPTEEVLTDDKAPVEMLTDSMLSAAWQEMKRN